jgi:hypothetical protein
MGATTAPVYNPKTCSLNLLFVDTHTGLTNESQNPGFFETRPHSLRCGPAALLQCGLFRYVISASIDASFRLVPHESAFFSRTCKPTSLGVVPCQVTAQASVSQAPWCVLYVWLQKGIRENMAWPEAIEFYALSCGSSRKPA